MTAHRVQPDPLHDRLVERVNDWVENALDPQACATALLRVLEICRKHEHGALRWEDQLKVPRWVPLIRGQIAEALNVESSGEQSDASDPARGQS